MRRAAKTDEQPLRRALKAAALVAVIASGVFGCASAAPTPNPNRLVAFPAGVPVPSEAVVEIGRDGPGTDQGHPFYTFSSQLPPGDALGAYTRQLAAVGFREIGVDAGWHRFASADTKVSVRVGSAGPPTTIFVRIDSAPANTGQGGGRDGGQGGGNGGANGAGNGEGPDGNNGGASGNGGANGGQNGVGPDASHGSNGAGSAASGAPNGNGQGPDANNGGGPNPNATKDPAPANTPNPKDSNSGNGGKPSDNAHPAPRQTPPPKPPPPHGGG